jgi:hypothetical protein
MEPEILHSDEVEADVECLMCARTIGQLYGRLWRTSAGRRTCRTIANLTTYRDNVLGAVARPVRPPERFRCPDCGGQGFVGEISVRTLIQRLPKSLCPIHIEPKTGPGRPATGCSCQTAHRAA